MDETHEEASRRIMNQLGGENRIPVINVREGDVGVLLGFPLAGLFAGTALGVDILAISLLFTGLFVGVTIIYATPKHQSAWGWLSDIARYVFARPRATYAYRTEESNPSTEGGLIEYTPFSVEESTQELTNIERAWPGAGAIQRTDCAMEAFIELRPANMDFAMADDWMAVQRAAEEFANNDLGFPLTLYATTRSFPAHRLVEQLDDRLEDPDVSENPVFEELLEEYRERRPAELADAQQLHYYLGVEVDQFDVYHRYEQEKTPSEKLTEFPLLGVLFTPFVTRREDFVEAERRAAMFEKLDERLRTVRTEFVESVSGWSSRRLSTVELFVLNMEYWNGEEYEAENAPPVIREEPVLRRTADARRDE